MLLERKMVKTNMHGQIALHAIFAKCRKTMPSQLFNCTVTQSRCVDPLPRPLSPDSLPAVANTSRQKTHPWFFCPSTWSCGEDWIYTRFEVKKVCTFEKGSVPPKSVTRRVKANAMVLGRKKNAMNTKLLYAFANEFRKTIGTSLSYKCSLSHSAMQSL